MSAEISFLKCLAWSELHNLFLAVFEVLTFHCSTTQFGVEWFKATNRGKLLCLAPQMVALIIALPGHFSSWNLMYKAVIIWWFAEALKLCWQ